MATVNYYLKGAFSKERLNEIKDKKLRDEVLETECQIYLKLSTGGERLQIYTKKRIAQNLWDSEKQEIDSRKLRKLGPKINGWLSAFREDVLNLATKNELEGIQTTKRELERILSDRSMIKRDGSLFEDHTNEFLNEHKSPSGNSMKPRTRQKYVGLIKHLKKFATHSRITLSVSSFNKDFFISFKEYLTHVKEQNDNTVVKNIKGLKTVVRFFMNKGLVKPFSLAEIKSVAKDGEIYVLPIKSVLTIQRLKLTNEEWKSARDIFCFMCWTGQRFSDYLNIKHSDFSFNERGEKVWKLVAEKTQKPILVPIVGYAQKILLKYRKTEFPIPRLTNDKMNEYLKEIGKEAKLDHSVKHVSYYDGKKEEESFPFYDVLTSHVARKSFITNSLILGIPERVVRDISGHTDEKSFRRYVFLADTYKSQLINKAFSVKNISKHLHK